jgi:deazaflavin-dependent oxidoreductase (nitroreductase family)
MTGPIEISPYAEANAFFRAMRRMAGWRPVSWLFARILPATDRFVSRITGRHLTFAGLATGLQVLMLTTTGAKTGARRTQPVAYLGQAGDFILIASNFGQERNPAWYYNLRASPRAQVTVSGSACDVIAREVTGPERDLYWEQGCRMYPAWNLYKARSRRQFPIMILARAG